MLKAKINHKELNKIDNENDKIKFLKTKKRKKRKLFQRGRLLWMQAFRLKNFPFEYTKR